MKPSFRNKLNVSVTTFIVAFVFILMHPIHQGSGKPFSFEGTGNEVVFNSKQGSFSLITPIGKFVSKHVRDLVDQCSFICYSRNLSICGICKEAMRIRLKFLAQITLVVLAIIVISKYLISKWINSLTKLPPVCGNDTDWIDIDAITRWNRPRVDLFMNIATAGKYYNRRKFIRDTWLSTVNKYSVSYRFFVDGMDIPSDERRNLTKEKETYKDLEFLPTKPGYWFAHRYLFAMFWAYEHYNFSFYMKVDDDYFVCLNNLQNDLQYRKHEKLLYWGNMGCDPKMVAIDEGFVIISHDLAREIMKRNNSLCCHPFGGQMIAMWINGLERDGYDVKYFADNSRLMHYRSHLKKEHSDMCKEIIGIHQAYPKHLARYWSITKDNWFSIQPGQFVKVKIKKYDEYCSLPKGWDWRVLSTLYRHEPKPCWKPGLRWPELEKYKKAHSREDEE